MYCSTRFPKKFNSWNLNFVFVLISVLWVQSLIYLILWFFLSKSKHVRLEFLRSSMKLFSQGLQLQSLQSLDLWIFSFFGASRSFNLQSLWAWELRSLDFELRPSILQNPDFQSFSTFLHSPKGSPQWRDKASIYRVSMGLHGLGPNCFWAQKLGLGLGPISSLAQKNSQWTWIGLGFWPERL